MTEEFRQRLCEHILGEHASPLPYYLGINMVDLEDGAAELSLKVQKNAMNAYNITHGGALMTLADCAMGAACFTYRKQVVTLDVNINYLKSTPLGAELRCVAKVLHNGAQTMVTTCDIIDEAGNLQAQARATFFVVGKFI